MNLQPELLENLNTIRLALDVVAPLIAVMALLAIAIASACIYALCRQETRQTTSRPVLISSRSYPSRSQQSDGIRAARLHKSASRARGLRAF
jgi:hypothetical protein